MVDPASREYWEFVQREQERFQAMEVDESLILANLRLSPLERLCQHDRALTQLLALRNAREADAPRER